jgi:hypothetical protein
MNKWIDWIHENLWNIIFVVWFLSSVLEFTGFVIDVKHSDTETKVSVETPIKEQKPKATDA